MKQPLVHVHSLCEASNVGDKATIGAFSHVLPGAVIGSEVHIDDHVFLENDVIIGDRVTIRSGVQLWDGIELEDDVFIGPNVTFTNDAYPRSKQHPESFSRTVIELGASVGGGAVILPGLRIGRRAMIGAGAVVTRNVPPFAIVAGNPARITGYTNGSGRRMAAVALSTHRADVENLSDARLVTLSKSTDMRGSLVAMELSSDLPFTPQRFFAVYGVPSQNIRGEHAHRACKQFLVCLKGSVRAITDDGVERKEFLLDSPEVGLYMPAMTWGTQYDYTPDAVLGVFASLPYDAADYIRTYAEFEQIALTGRNRAADRNAADGLSPTDDLEKGQRA